MRLISLFASLSVLVGCADPNPTESPDLQADAASPESPGGWRSVLEAAPQGLLLGVWGRADDEIYFVGGQADQTAVARWDGERLLWQQTPGTARAWWVTGFEEPPLTVVVGEAGLGLRKVGDGPWTEWSTGTNATLFGAWGQSADDLWVVGGDIAEGGPPVLRHFDGALWTDAELPDFAPLEPAAFFKVWGAAADDVFVAGDRGVMLHYNGLSWRRVPAPPTDAVLTIHGNKASGVWAVGGRGRGIVWRWTGQAWIPDGPTQDLPGLAGVFATAAGEVLISGDRGVLMERSAAGEWRHIPTETRDLIHSIWTSRSGARWAVGGDMMSPRPPNRGLILRGDGPLDSVGGPGNTAPDAGVPEPETCDPKGVRGKGVHRLYLQGRQGTPDAFGRYPMVEDRDAIVHGEHYLLGEGAFVEWTARLCADISGAIYFYLPNNDEAGSEVRHELFLVRDGVPMLLAETLDTQAGESGYNPFTDRQEVADPAARAGDELLLRSTNLNDVMYSVMVFNPPSDYMSYIEVELTEDGPPHGERGAGGVDTIPCAGELEIGPGASTSFRPFAEGERTPLITGPQGSFMVSIALRGAGIEPGTPGTLADGNPLVELWATLGATQIGNLRQRIGFDAAGEQLTTGGLILTINPNWRANQMVGQPLQIDASVIDQDGLRLCGTAVVTPTQ